MERTAFVLKVKKEKLNEYKLHHEKVWPDMLDALKRNGWANYSIFASEDGTLFGYVEAEEDFQSCLDGMGKEEINSKWQKFMELYFEDLSGLPNQSMLKLEEVFHTG